MDLSVLLLLFCVAHPHSREGNYSAGDLFFTLNANTYTIAMLNRTYNTTMNFSFVPPASTDAPIPIGCHSLGDVTLRLRHSSNKNEDTQSSWVTMSSADNTNKTATQLPCEENIENCIFSADITPLMNLSTNDGNVQSTRYPVKVVRTYAESKSPEGLAVSFNITNMEDVAIEIGGFGMSMPQAGGQHHIEQSVWNDPYIGGDHGFVEWVRVVVDQQSLLAITPPHSTEKSGNHFEAWRPILENTCRGDVWEWTVYSKSWAEEWKYNQQYPYLKMADNVFSTGVWPHPKSPWPSWQGSDTIPVTNFEGIAQPYNNPTSRILQPGESFTSTVLLSTTDSPRARSNTLLAAGKVVFHAVPGYVLTPSMSSAQLLIVTPSASLTIHNIETFPENVLRVSSPTKSTTSQDNNIYRVNITASSQGRCRVTVVFSDSSQAHLHYMVLPPLPSLIDKVGHHWAYTAWLPRDYPDPFGRSASVLPWDREDNMHVMDDARAYDVGLSDDCGGGNPLGFAMKVGFAPKQDEVTRIDDFIKWTLYGIKTDTAKPPYKSLQMLPGDRDPDGIRMTLFYYNNFTRDKLGHSYPSKNWSGHFYHNYTEAHKCALWPVGPDSWCMDERSANATYRSFNYPHHTASYYSMYRIARYYTKLNTYRTWQWYLGRAANTTIRFGAPGVGVMDGTVFREVLRSVKEEASLQRLHDISSASYNWTYFAERIEANMFRRASGFSRELYPYGSEFSFDTTGQEEVVVWLTYFSNDTNLWNVTALRTVNHILSYMRSSSTWSYHGGARSGGDLDAGKWLPTVGTVSRFETRGNFHYRSCLNMIPIIEWYRAHPDDHFLLEISMGAITGTMSNIHNESGAPGKFYHMLPYILDHDPRSGDFGLGFFGLTLEVGSYFVNHRELGILCYLCDYAPTSGNDSYKLLLLTFCYYLEGAISITPRDSYQIRVFLEPLSLYLTLDCGNFNMLTLNLDKKEITVQFEEEKEELFSVRRLRIEKTSNLRPGTKFKLSKPENVNFSLGAFGIPTNSTTAVITWM
eukprot:m.72838 g.72838  ORF g.72838 m.72838 type:complete len:1030 (+) comp12363_c0_seq3:71-3160(+)